MLLKTTYLWQLYPWNSFLLMGQPKIIIEIKNANKTYCNISAKLAIHHSILSFIFEN